LKNYKLYLLFLSIILLLLSSLGFATKPSDSITGGYFVFFNATSISSISDFQINDCNITYSLEESGWFLYATSGNNITHRRAKVIKTLFFGTDGSNPRASTSYITGINITKTSYYNDVGKRGHYINMNTINFVTYTGTFLNTTNNYNTSSWSNLDYSGGGSEYIRWEMPVSTVLNNAAGSSTSFEIGTDTTHDDKNNPSNCAMHSEGNNPNNGKAIILSYGNITWAKTAGPGSGFSFTAIDFYQTYNFKPFELYQQDNLIANAEIYPTTLFQNTTVNGRCYSNNSNYSIINYSWYKNNINILNGSISGTFYEDILYNPSNLSSNNFTYFDNISFSCQIGNVTDYSNIVNSGNYFVNRLPIYANALIYPTNILNSTENVLGQCYSDDTNYTGINYIWYKNYIQYLNGTSTGSFVQSVIYNPSNLTNLNFTTGDNLTFSCQIYDNYNISNYDNSTTVQVIATNIIINSLNITSSYLEYNDIFDIAYWNAENLTCIANITGAEAIEYNWYKNNVLFLNNNSFLSNNNFTLYDNLTCEVIGYNMSENNSDTKTINIFGSYLQNVTMYTGSLYCQYNGTAINNATIQWKGNGIEIYNETLFGDNNVSKLNDSYTSSLFNYSCTVYSYPIQNVTWSVFDSYNNITNVTESGMIQNISIIPYPSYWDSPNLTCTADSLNYVTNVSYEWNIRENYIYNYCYQEQANETNGCGDIGTGTYEILEVDNVTGIGLAYINYTYNNTFNVNNSLWEICRGYDEQSSPWLTMVECINKTIPKTCYYDNKLRILLNVSSGIKYSLCFNSTDWLDIEPYSGASALLPSCGTGISTAWRMFDKDINTGAFVFSPFYTWASDPVGISCTYHTSSSILEERMYWAYNETVYNITKNESVIQNSDFQIYDNLTCKITTYSDFVYDIQYANTTILGSRIDSVTIIGNTPYVQTSNLNCSYSGEHINYTIIAWYKNGTYVSNEQILPSIYLDNNSVYNCTVFSYPYQNDSWSVVNSNNRIENLTYIYISVINITPVIAFYNNSLLCSYKSNPMCSILNNTWYKNGVFYYENISTLNPPGSFVHFDNITCEAYAICGTTNYTIKRNTSIIISNYIPITQSSSIIPVTGYVGQTLNGYCNVTDSDNDNISYEYNWYRNNIINETGITGYLQQGINFNIDNFSNTFENDNITFECRGFDVFNYSNYLNSSNVTINADLSIDFINANPTYPRTDQNINCQFNVNSISSYDLNVSITWYMANDDGNFINDNTYDYTYVNVTKLNLYTTGALTGSVESGTFNDYTNWKCEVSLTNGFSTIKQNSTIRNVYPLENLTIHSPDSGYTYNKNILINYSVIDKDEGIVCNLYFNETLVNISNVTSGVYNVVNYTPTNSGTYYYNISCIANGNPTPIWSETRIYNYNTIGTIYNNVVTNEDLLYPNIGDIMYFNATLTNLYQINNCSLLINNTHTIFNYVQNLSINTNNTYNLSMYYVVGIGSVNPIYWKFICRDNAGNVNESQLYNFTYKDIVNPIAIIGSGNNFGTNNRTIINGLKHNLSINLTFVDYNLFQAEINVTCAINGTIFEWQDLNITTTEYNYFNNSISLNYPMQKCNIFYAVSDDHTANEIENYKDEKIDNGIKFETTENNKIEIISNDNDLKDTKTKKLTDRESFEFSYNNKKLKRTFIIKSDNILYYRSDSKYRGHFVVWNDKTGSGNWIDFEDISGLHKKYNITQIDKFTYQIEIESKIPDNIDEILTKEENIFNLFDSYKTKDEKILEKYGLEQLKFNSIGGLNIVNYSYDFYIGGQINISSLNIYDNSIFDNYSVRITSLTAFPPFNASFNITGFTEVAENFTNGTYRYEFSSPKYFSQTYIVNVINQSQNLTYQSYQSQVNFIVRNIITEEFLQNFNVTVLNLNTTFTESKIGNMSMLSFYMNSSYFNYSIIQQNYYPFYGNDNVEYKENLTITADMGFAANLTLIDERTFELFDVTSPDRILFILDCVNYSFSQVLNATSTIVPIQCKYKKFQFILDYNTTSYTRFIIIPPDEALNLNVYLINALTTQAVYFSFYIDDLFNDYENVSIYLKRVIGNQTPIITSNYVDAEDKMDAYLIENVEYLIEIHSDNNPIRQMGPYSATVPGSKTFRLYDISLNPDVSQSGMVYASIMLINETTNESVIYATYGDEQNLTDSVTLNIYLDGYNQTLLYSLPVSLSSNSTSSIEWEQNMTGYHDRTVVTEFVINRRNTNGESIAIITFIKTVNEQLKILLDVFDYISQEFMNWFITLIISVLAIFTTIRSSNMASIGLLGLSALFIVFGWFTMSWAIMALCMIVAFLSILKEGEKRP
jgi:hypothetical protein